MILSIILLGIRWRSNHLHQRSKHWHSMKYDNDREVGIQDRTMRYAVSHVSPSTDPYCKMKGLPCDMWYEPRRLPHQTYSRLGERLSSNVCSRKQSMTITERFGCKGLYQQLKRPVPVIDCFLLRLSWMITKSTSYSTQQWASLVPYISPMSTSMLW